MPAPLDLDQLRTFVAVAETGSFTRAAEEVAKTQSAVSMQIKKLEERIGQPLILRDGRANRLTGHGLKLLDYARRMVGLNEEAISAFSDDAFSGVVRLGVPDDYADRLLPRVFAAFARSHPSVELEVQCEGSSCLTRRIGEGRVDLAIVTSADAGGYGKLIRRERLLWVTGEAQGAQALDPLPLALGPATCTWRHAAQHALDQVGRAYRIVYTSASATPIVGAVLAGLAVSVLPESALRTEMRVLGPEDGFPALPTCDIGLLRAVHATRPVHDALATHIEQRIGNVGALALAAE